MMSIKGTGIEEIENKLGALSHKNNRARTDPSPFSHAPTTPNQHKAHHGGDRE